MTTDTDPLAWAPTVCTLPTAERPLRLAEFDDLFRASLRRVEQLAPTRARLTLAETGGTRATTEDLTARESACCSFFTFTVTPVDVETVTLDVEVPPAQVDVLTALTTRASAVQPI